MRVYAWLIDLIHRRKIAPRGWFPGGSKKRPNTAGQYSSMVIINNFVQSNSCMRTFVFEENKRFCRILPRYEYVWMVLAWLPVWDALVRCCSSLPLITLMERQNIVHEPCLQLRTVGKGSLRRGPWTATESSWRGLSVHYGLHCEINVVCPLKRPLQRRGMRSRPVRRHSRGNQASASMRAVEGNHERCSESDKITS